MKKIDLAQTIGILANLGVIAGVVFLAYEINQNNKLLRAEADYNYMQGRVENRRLVATDPEYAAFWEKVESDQISAGSDMVRLVAHIEATILGWQWEYGQVVDGYFVDDLDAVTERWRVGVKSDGAVATEFPRVWASLRPTLRGDFVEFIESDVLAP